MPAPEKIAEGVYRYQCECGQEMELHLPPGEKLDSLVKCFACQQPITKLFEEEE